MDVSALMDMPDIVKQAHKDISQQLTKLNKVPTPSVAKVATVLETEKGCAQDRGFDARRIRWPH